METDHEPAPSDSSPIVTDAVRLLRHRLRSVAELRQRLTAKGYAPTSIEQCLERLSRAGFLDDRRFAIAFVRDGVALQQRGAIRLRRDLRSRGVADQYIDEALDLVLSGQAAVELAAEVAEKYAPRLAGLPPQKARQRLQGYLQRRGFSWDEIEPLLDRHAGGEPLDP